MVVIGLVASGRRELENFQDELKSRGRVQENCGIGFGQAPSSQNPRGLDTNLSPLVLDLLR